jgi:hypothetical protein
MLGSLFNKSRAEINRENAQKSTGPKSAAGKAVSSRNALKEGFTASFAIVAPEDEEFYEQFVASHRTELNPQGAQQEDIFRRITLAAWNIRRIEKLTFALYEETGTDPLASGDPAILSKFERYTRHQTLNDRAYYRGVKQLRLLQKERSVQSANCPQPSAPTETAQQSHQPSVPETQPAAEPASPTKQPPEPENTGDKTKPEPTPALPPQNAPANQQSKDSAPQKEPPCGPSHLPNHFFVILERLSLRHASAASGIAILADRKWFGGLPGIN